LLLNASSASEFSNFAMYTPGVPMYKKGLFLPTVLSFSLYNGDAICSLRGGD